MIRIALLVCLALAAGTGVAYFLHEDPGYVLVHVGGWVLETSLLGLLLGLVATGLALIYGLRFLRLAFDLPGTVRRVLRRRRAERARDAFELGLLHLAEGRWKRAEVELVRRAADHRAAALNYLHAARAAQQLGARERRNHYLSLATTHSAKEVFAALMTQAQLQVESAEWPLARATLAKLRAHDPKHPEVVRLLLRCAAAQSDWPAVLELLDQAETEKALETARDPTLRLLARQRLLEASSELAATHALWERTGAAERDNTAVRLAYAEALVRHGADSEALAVIDAGLRQEWTPLLVRLAGRLGGADRIGLLASIEQWLSRYGERPELLLTAGRVCTDAQLWGKARGYLEATARAEPRPEVFLALAQLCERTQAGDEAARYYRQGLELSAQQGH